MNKRRNFIKKVLGSIIMLMIIFQCRPSQVFAQEKLTVYFDKYGDVTSSSNADNYIVVHTTNENYVSINSFFKNDSKKSTGTYFIMDTSTPIDYENFYKPEFFSILVKDGTYKEWYPNGNSKEEGVYQKGLKHGEYRQWYDNGNLMSLSFLKNGREEGEVLVYFEKGGINLKYKTEDGQIIGEISEWYENGIKRKTVEVKAGGEIGEVHLYDQQGNEIITEQ